MLEHLSIFDSLCGQIRLHCVDILHFVYTFIMDIWVVFTFWLLWIMLLRTFMFEIFCGYIFSILWGAEITGSDGNRMFNFLKNCQTFPKWLYHFTFSPAVHKVSDVSTSLSALAITWLFYYSHPSLCAVEFLCGFVICISLMTNDVDHLFMRLLSFCISSLNKCLFGSSLHF